MTVCVSELSDDVNLNENVLEPDHTNSFKEEDVLWFEVVAEFARKIEDRGNIDILGTQMDDNNDECFVLKCGNFVYHVTVKSIIENNNKSNYIDSVLDIVSEKRDAVVLHGMSRIVGYFSRITNWNNSKAKYDVKGNLVGGELHDRHIAANTYSVNKEL